MSRPAPTPARQRARVTATTMALLAGVALPGATAAVAIPESPTTSCRSDQPRLRHLVLFGQGTTAERARAEISGACGSLSGYYPEIAVAIATSADGTFADRLGRDRAYSAQAEALAGTEPTARPARSTSTPSGVLRAVGVQAETTVDGAPAGSARASRSRTTEQWDMDLIGATQAHDLQRGSTDVLVGVLDSGIDPDHPELASALDRSASAGCLTGMPDTSASAWLPSSNHGTHVAGIIAATDDGVGVTGVAPGVRIAAVKVVDGAGFIYPESALCGFMWAARRHMHIANHSYYVDPWLFTCQDVPGQSVVYEALRRAAGYATRRGVLSLAAAGNRGLDLAQPGTDPHSPSNARRPQPRALDQDCRVLPAQLPAVLTVSAVGAAGVKSSYSSYGLGVVDLAAPGGDVRQRSPAATSGCVLSTVTGGYGWLCGTSMATPHVAGVAALAASEHPGATPADITELLLASATPVSCPAGGYDPDSDGHANAQCRTAEFAGDTGRATRRHTSFYGVGLVNAPGVLR